MTTIYDYMGGMFKDRVFHFKCDCVLALDVVGTVVDYEIRPPEIILIIQTNEQRLIKIGTNHPNLSIEEV